MTDVLISEMRAGLMVLTMNRPENRNALNPALCVALTECLGRAAEDPAVRAVVLTGAGGTFSVGGDVKAMNEGSGRNAPESERVVALRSHGGLALPLRNAQADNRGHRGAGGGCRAIARTRVRLPHLRQERKAHHRLRQCGRGTGRNTILWFRRDDCSGRDDASWLPTSL